VTPAAFRKAALALPEVVEGSHHGHADFRLHGRVIASLHPDGAQAMVKVPVSLQQELVGALGDACVPASGAWGRAGCTMLRLAAIEAAVARDALQAAWEFGAVAAAAKPKKLPRSPRRSR
jgi:hypothetical protein